MSNDLVHGQHKLTLHDNVLKLLMREAFNEFTIIEISHKLKTIIERLDNQPF